MTNDEQFTALAQLIMDFQEEVRQRFDGVDTRLDRAEDRMNFMDGRLDLLEASNREQASKHTQVLDLLDGIASRLDIDDSERVALSAQVTRLEDWVIEAAPAVNVKYVPGA